MAARYQKTDEGYLFLCTGSAIKAGKIHSTGLFPGGNYLAHGDPILNKGISTNSGNLYDLKEKP